MARTLHIAIDIREHTGEGNALDSAVLRHRRVRFRVKDVCVPTPAEVLEDLFGAEVIEGEVVDLTGSRADRDAFVVVRVRDLPPLLVVPAALVRIVDKKDV